MCGKFSHNEDWYATWCWCSPTRHTTSPLPTDWTQTYFVNKSFQHQESQLLFGTLIVYRHWEIDIRGWDVKWGAPTSASIALFLWVCQCLHSMEQHCHVRSVDTFTLSVSFIYLSKVITSALCCTESLLRMTLLNWPSIVCLIKHLTSGCILRLRPPIHWMQFARCSSAFVCISLHVFISIRLHCLKRTSVSGLWWLKN